MVGDVFELENITQQSTMREFILEAKKRLGINGLLTVDLSDEQGRDYIKSAYCVYCWDEVPVKVPRYKFKMKWLYAKRVRILVIPMNPAHRLCFLYTV